MSEKTARKTSGRTVRKPSPLPSALGAEAIKELMRAAAKGAAELDNKMKPLFQLSDRTASLRFK